MAVLPDFLLLPEADVSREKQRQDQLRRDFNTRARQTPAEEEAARAMILEESLRQSLKNIKNDPESKKLVADRLADNLASQGRFTEAAKIAIDPSAKEFYAKAAEAVFVNKECVDTGPIEVVGQTRIRLPKYRVIKEIFSLKLGQFGFLAECNSCKQWVVLGSNPLPQAPNPIDFDPATAPNDLQILKI